MVQSLKLPWQYHIQLEVSHPLPHGCVLEKCDLSATLQFSNRQLPLSDQDLITKCHDLRLANHPPYEIQTPLVHLRPFSKLEVGDLAYIYSDRKKSKARDCYQYLFTKVEGDFCNLQKFIGSQLHSTSYTSM